MMTLFELAQSFLSPCVILTSTLLIGADEKAVDGTIEKGRTNISDQQRADGTGQQREHVGGEFRSTESSQLEFRTWTHRSGQYRAEAAIIDVENGMARLKKPDGRTVTIAVDFLSEADREFIRSWSIHNAERTGESRNGAKPETTRFAEDGMGSSSAAEPTKSDSFSGCEHTDDEVKPDSIDPLSEADEVANEPGYTEVADGDIRKDDDKERTDSVNQPTPGIATADDHSMASVHSTHRDVTRQDGKPQPSEKPGYGGLLATVTGGALIAVAVLVCISVLLAGVRARRRSNEDLAVGDSGPLPDALRLMDASDVFPAGSEPSPEGKGNSLGDKALAIASGKGCPRAADITAIQETDSRYQELLDSARSAGMQHDVDGQLKRLREARAIPNKENLSDVLDAWHDAGRYCRRKSPRGARLIRTFNGHDAWVTCVAITPDGRRCLSGGRDGKLKLWDLFTGECQQTVPTCSLVDALAVSPDGRRVLSAQGTWYTLKLWDLSTGACVWTVEGLRPRWSRLPSGWTGEGHTATINSVAISPDGRLGLSGGGNWSWSAASEDRLLHPSHTRTLKLWDLSTGVCLRTFEVHEEKVNSVAFSPDGRLSLSGSEDKTLKLWDLSTGSCQQTFRTEYGVDTTAISPDGRFILSGHYGKTLKLFDLATGARQQTFHTGGTTVAISPDSGFILSAGVDTTLKLWDSSTGVCLRTLEGHSEPVRSVTFSPDGRYILSGSDDTTLKLWELDWDYEFPGWADWDDGAKPYLEAFLTLHTRVHKDRVTRKGSPRWTDKDFQQLLTQLQHRGYGWLRPEGVRGKLHEMAPARRRGLFTIFRKSPSLPQTLATVMRAPSAVESTSQVAKTAKDASSDDYVEDCFDLQWSERPDDRVVSDVLGAQAIVDVGNAGRTEEAIQLAQQLCTEQPDYWFSYCWLGILQRRERRFVEARRALQEGLQHAKRKYNLCEQLGELEWETNDLPEAVKWWIRCVVLQLEAATLSAHTSFLRLSYVADEVGLTETCRKLLDYVDEINVTSPRLAPEAGMKLRAAARVAESSDLRLASSRLHEMLGD